MNWVGVNVFSTTIEALDIQWFCCKTCAATLQKELPPDFPRWRKSCKICGWLLSWILAWAWAHSKSLREGKEGWGGWFEGARRNSGVGLMSSSLLLESSERKKRFRKQTVWQSGHARLLQFECFSSVPVSFHLVRVSLARGATECTTGSNCHFPFCAAFNSFPFVVDLFLQLLVYTFLTFSVLCMRLNHGSMWRHVLLLLHADWLVARCASSASRPINLGWLQFSIFGSKPTWHVHHIQPTRKR